MDDASSQGPTAPPQQQPQQRPKHVLIIGAGISGLAAARELTSRGYSVLVLDARRRPGGRLKTVPLSVWSSEKNDGRPPPIEREARTERALLASRSQRYRINLTERDDVCLVDAGGQFVHGIGEPDRTEDDATMNPIAELAFKLGVHCSSVDKSYNCLLLNDAGWPVDPNVDARVDGKFNECLDAAHRECGLAQHSEDGDDTVDGEGEDDGEEDRKVAAVVTSADNGANELENSDGHARSHDSRVDESRGGNGRIDGVSSSAVAATAAAAVLAPSAVDTSAEKTTRSPVDDCQQSGEETCQNPKQPSLSSSAAASSLSVPDNEAKEEDEEGKPAAKAQDSSSDASTSEQEKGSTRDGDGGDDDVSFGEVFFRIAEDATSTMSPDELDLFNWHVSNLEMSCGTSLTNLGKHWNEDEPYGYPGEHVALREGFGAVIHGLARGIRIEYGTEVGSVTIVPPKGWKTRKRRMLQERRKEQQRRRQAMASSDDAQPPRQQQQQPHARRSARIREIGREGGHGGLSVTHSSKKHDGGGTERNSREEPPSSTVVVGTNRGRFKCDAVIVTVPLGVLKVTDRRSPGNIVFDPPLPERKRKAIERMGFGSYNKCIMTFESRFWPDVDFIGHCSKNHGENILFFNVSGKHDNEDGGGAASVAKPWISLIFGGAYARKVERLSDNRIVSEACRILRKCCGLKEVPTPIDYVVTRWTSDPYARGAFSFVPPGVSWKEHEHLASPIIDPVDDLVPSLSASPVAMRERHVANDVAHSSQHTEERKQNTQDSSPSIDRKIQPRPIVLFAGEATTPFHPSTIHGAYLSGIREAYRMDICHDPVGNGHMEFDFECIYKRTFQVRRQLPGGFTGASFISRQLQNSGGELESNSGGGTSTLFRRRGKNAGTREPDAQAVVSRREGLRRRRDIDSSTPQQLQSPVVVSSQIRSSRRTASTRISPYGYKDDAEDSFGDSSGDDEVVEAPSVSPTDFTLAEDRTLLRGVDSYGLGAKGLAMIRQRMGLNKRPGVLRARYKKLIDSGADLNVASVADEETLNMRQQPPSIPAQSKTTTLPQKQSSGKRSQGMTTRKRSARRLSDSSDSEDESVQDVLLTKPKPKPKKISQSQKSEIMARREETKRLKAAVTTRSGRKSVPLVIIGDGDAKGKSAPIVRTRSGRTSVPTGRFIADA